MDVLRSLGLDPVLGAHVLNQDHTFSYLAARDEARLEDLHRMFLDPCIKAVFCARGGYDSYSVPVVKPLRFNHSTTSFHQDFEASMMFHMRSGSRICERN